jgi:hypothetical protein
MRLVLNLLREQHISKAGREMKEFIMRERS